MFKGSGYLIYYYHLKDVEDVIFFRLHGETPVGELNFNCYHLRKELYEEVAREAGLKGDLEWGVTRVPERYFKGEGPGGAGLVELETYQIIPNYRVLIITK